MTENWYIMCYCSDKIEAEDEIEAYIKFCKKHDFKEKNAEFISSSKVDCE